MCAPEQSESKESKSFWWAKHPEATSDMTTMLVTAAGQVFLAKCRGDNDNSSSRSVKAVVCPSLVPLCRPARKVPEGNGRNISSGVDTWPMRSSVRTRLCLGGQPPWSDRLGRWEEGARGVAGRQMSQTLLIRCLWQTLINPCVLLAGLRCFRLP